MIGGCFFAGTGGDPNRSQAFVTGVLQMLLENQNYVTWTSEALSVEQLRLRWTRLGYTIVAVAVGATALAIAYSLVF